MNMVILNKFVSVFLVIFLLAQTILPSFAQESPTPTPTGEPTPTEEISLTPTPTPDPTQADLNEEVLTTEESSDSATLTISPDGTTYTTNTGNDTTIETTDTSSLSTTIDNSNTAEIDRVVDASNDTGNNILTDNIALQGGTNTIVTGDAETIQNITTVVNTNVVAQSAAIVLKDVTEPNNEPINLSSLAPCYAPGTILTPSVFDTVNSGNNVTLIDSQTTENEMVIRNNNTADITNDVTLTSNTGDNSAINNISSGTSVQTGDAYSSLNLFTMANTNLVGNCYFFGVINLFGDQNGDIIFPYELDILNNSLNPLVFTQHSTTLNTGDDVTINESSNSEVDTIIKNTNTASVNESVTSTNTTGDNQMIDTISFNTIGSIVTGDANSSHNVIDMINSNYLAKNFFILLINRYGNWNGQVVGLDSSYMLLPQAGNPSVPNLYSTLITNVGDNLNSSTSSNTNNLLVVENTNNLNVNNLVSLNNNTGGNEAGRFNPSIQTGNAQSQANIVTMGNTNITGDNWFFAVINIFDNFIGNIVFPRPELVVSKVVDQPSHNAGDNFTYTIAYGNFGNTFTDNVVVTDTLPSGVTLVAASEGYTLQGNIVSWHVGKLEPGQTGAVTLLVQTNQQQDTTDLANIASISGNRVENSYDNNSSTAMVHIWSRNSANSNSNSTQQNTTVVNSVSTNPLGGSITPIAATTAQNPLNGAVMGSNQTVAEGNSETDSKVAECGTACQVKALKSDQSILTILTLLLVLLLGVRERFA